MLDSTFNIRESSINLLDSNKSNALDDSTWVDNNLVYCCSLPYCTPTRKLLGGVLFARWWLSSEAYTLTLGRRSRMY